GHPRPDAELRAGGISARSRSRHAVHHPRPDQHAGPAESPHRAVRSHPPCGPLQVRAAGMGASLPLGVRHRPAPHLRADLSARTGPFREVARLMATIRVQNLGVQFHLDRQVRPVTPAMTRIRRRCTTVWALRNLSVEIGPGQGIALVGRNGAGKSTLLRAMAGVLPPDEGKVEVSGRIGALLVTDAGLMTPLTGRENALLLGVLAGLPKPEVRELIGSIKERSGLADAFEPPVATYSQGRRARLGFAVIEHVKPEI